MDHNKIFYDPNLCQKLLKRLDCLMANQNMRFMEVCGTHTVSMFRSGIRQLLPKNITHLSGPGCPVCVTHDSEVSVFFDLANNKDVIIATFGDLLRIPNPDGKSLKYAIANGAKVEIIYSPLQALDIAKANLTKIVVFLGVGFETTIPTVASTIMLAKEQKLKNFCVLSMHKCVPQALKELVEDKNCHIDAFLLPGHVTTIIGLEPYKFLSTNYHIPSAVGGFEPADILYALCCLAEQIKENKPSVVNAYKRAVSNTGNEKAKSIINKVFEPCDALWRGIGKINLSGYQLREEYEEMDAVKRFNLEFKEVKKISGCSCGEVLKGYIQPVECPLFAKKCTPSNPIGPCMVSTEGSCAAYYQYMERM